MITIDRIETRPIDLPTIRAHVLTTMRSQAIVLVRIRCSDGSEGWGEGTTIGSLVYCGESPEGIRLTIERYLAPLLIGCDAERPAAAMARVAGAVVGNHFAKCPIETALLDAAGRRAGLPLSELLSGRRRDVLPVAWTLASGDTAQDIAEAQEMLDNYSLFDPSQSAFNYRRRILADPNGAYRFRSIVPKGYGVPPGGSTDRLPRALGRHGQRPAHIHFVVSKDWFRHLTTQINIDGDPYLHDDCANATRDELIAPAVRHEGAEEIAAAGLDAPFAEIAFDFALLPATSEGQAALSLRARLAP